MYRIAEDFRAISERDPAVRGFWGSLEVILCYSGFHALILYRFYHFLHTVLHIPVIPRLLSQITRFLTGVEIHPGARIGKGFFIDHGMGVVIGETTIVGDYVTLYQGVTLGGTGKESGKRHPTLGNHIVVGAGARVLGNIVLGDHVKVGAGSVLVTSVPEHCTVVGIPAAIVRQYGEKIEETPETTLKHADLPDPIANKLASIQAEMEYIEEHLKNCKRRYRMSQIEIQRVTEKKTSQVEY